MLSALCLVLLAAASPLQSTSRTAGSYPSVAPPDTTGTAAVAARWRALDVALFTAAPEPADTPLLRGLKALVAADVDAADSALAEALAAAPDALRPFVRARLADVAAERFDWAAAVARRAVDDPQAVHSVEAGFARFPAARLRMDAAETTVPFDGLRVPAALNGAPVRAVVDTGAPGSSVSRALALRLGLRVDTTARGRSRVPSLGLAFDTYAVLLDSVRLGEATLFNVPATVGWRDAADEDEIFLGADVLRHLAAAVRFDYVDSTFTLVRSATAWPSPDDRPNFLVDAGSAPVVAVTVAGQPANAIVDTGNQRSVYLARGAFDLAGVPVSRTLSGTYPGGTWTQAFVRLPVAIPGHPPLVLEAYEAEGVFQAGDPVTVVLGRTVWAGGALTVDFAHRRVRFDAR